MIKLILITNNPKIANHAAKCGVDRFFVDLEILGKTERQGHRNTRISKHRIEDIYKIREAVQESELIVRINPYNHLTGYEIESAISAGADYIMLPMFRDIQTLGKVSEIIGGRIGFIPLVETAQSVKIISSVINHEGVSEIFVGLNDLHVELGMCFMFEVLTSGIIEKISSQCNEKKLKFGFGGIARMFQGDLPGSLVLAEHLRLNSESVILSRTFVDDSDGKSLEDCFETISEGVKELRRCEVTLRERTPYQIECDRTNTFEKVRSIIENRSNKGGLK